jgi:hypothetical protein
VKAVSGSGKLGSMKLSHNVTESPHRPIKGAKTKTDREPMSSPEYHKHMRKIK